MECKFSKDHGFSHEENRYKICLICLRKTEKMFEINEHLLKNLKSALNMEFVLEDHLPASLCSSCKRNISFKLSKDNTRNVTLKLPDFSKFSDYEKRSSVTEKRMCSCYLCELARQLYKSKNKRKSNVTVSKSQKNVTTKRCCKCFKKIGQGVSHKCNRSACVENLMQEIKENLDLPQKKKLIKNLIDDGSVNSTPITKQRPEPFVISSEDFIKIKTKHNLSSKTALSVATDFRIATRNRKFFQSGIKRLLFETNHRADEFFSVTKKMFTKTVKKVESSNEQTIIYCNKLSAYIDYIKNKRDVSDCHLKFGIDGGGGSLKVCLSIQSLDITNNVKSTENEKKRQKYSDGVGYTDFKDSGVKKLFILAIAPGAQENYMNVFQIWNLLDINDLLYTVATDLKLANILTGLMAHSSTYPCTWCCANKNELHERGEFRTIGNCKSYYDAWVKNGSKKKDAKNYQCCINPPIFSGDDSKKILDIIPPPELHLMLGVVNTMVDNMEKECEESTESWIRKCNVKREVANGGTGFNGNSCRTLLKKVDILRANGDIRCLKYVETFSKFKDVVDACFGVELDPKYCKKIDSFKNSYMDLSISVTPKVHAVFFHVQDFCSGKKNGLGFFSEQAMESVHHDYLTTSKRYNVSTNHDDYDQYSLRSLCDYNANHE